MDKKKFIDNFRKAFGNYELPVAFWYSDQPTAITERTKGCFFKYLKPAREGRIVCFDADTISCGGGKVYTGFSKILPHIPKFVSIKERYKEKPAMVVDFINDLNMPDKSGKYINFVSLDKIQDFSMLEGLLFFATPDVLSGLVFWAQYDNNYPDVVSVPFGSGCSSMISQTVVENQKNGYRVFLGLFDPSVRPHIEANVLGFAIPMSRFKKMYYTFENSCIGGAHAWLKIKERIAD